MLFFIVTIRGEFPIELCLERNNSFVFMVVRHDNNMPFIIRKTKNSSFKNEKSKKEVDVTITVSNKDIV